MSQYNREIDVESIEDIKGNELNDVFFYLYLLPLLSGGFSLIVLGLNGEKARQSIAFGGSSHWGTAGLHLVRDWNKSSEGIL